MFDVGFSELLLIAIMGLIILGPERLPRAARTVGTWVKKIRTAANNLTAEIERELQVDDLKKELASKNEEIMKQANELSKKLNKPVESIMSLDEKPEDVKNIESVNESKQDKEK